MPDHTQSVLLVEDNVVLSDVIRFNLNRSGLSVVVARNGREAVESLSRQSFDVLVTDYEMPFLNGEELCCHVRKELGLKDLPIVMCSAKGLELDCKRLKTLYSLSEIMLKPFSMFDLTSLVVRLANNQIYMSLEAPIG